MARRGLDAVVVGCARLPASRPAEALARLAGGCAIDLLIDAAEGTLIRGHRYHIGCRGYSSDQEP
jgi:hypothetical protein